MRKIFSDKTIEKFLISVIPVLEKDIDELTGNDREKAVLILEELKQRKRDLDMEKLILRLRELSQED